VFNNFEVGRQKLINLLYADRKNEKFKTPHLMISVILFIISLVVLGIAYFLVLKKPTAGYQVKDEEIITAMILGVVGTLLFFFSLSGFFLKVIQQNKSVYLKGLNMFVLRQLNSKINTAYVSITMVCLMLFLAICGLSFGMSISKSLTSEMERFNPYDATYTLFASEDIYDESGEWIDSKNLDINLLDEFKQTKIPVNSYAKKMVEFKLYDSDLRMDLGDRNYGCDLIKLSDYNKLLEMQGKPTVTVSGNEFIVNCIDAALCDDFFDYTSKNNLYVGDKEMTLKNADESVIFNTRSQYGFIFVLSDELLINQEIRMNMLVFDYIEQTKEYNELFTRASQQMTSNVTERTQTEDNNISVSTYSLQKINNFEESKSTSVTVAYLAVYIGIVFLIISAVMLAITQLSEASDNSARYGLLGKLGADGKMINKALFSQIAIYFGVPLLLALVHAIFGLRFANDLITQIGKSNILRDSALTAVVLITIYGGYFLATYFGSKRIIGNK